MKTDASVGSGNCEVKAERKNETTGRCDVDRNDGGGDHHRAVCGAGIAEDDASSRSGAKSPRRTPQINAFLTALGSYKLDTGVFPTTEQGLQALREKPEGVENWQGPYLQKEIENDPWKHPYVYHYPGDHGDEPDIISYGADGQPGGDGINADIVSWKN